MSKKLAVIAVHGMGETKSDFADDIEINAVAGLGGAVVRGWNPLCHGEYWVDRQFLDALAEQVRSSLAT